MRLSSVGKAAIGLALREVGMTPGMLGFFLLGPVIGTVIFFWRFGKDQAWNEIESLFAYNVIPMVIVFGVACVYYFGRARELLRSKENEAKFLRESQLSRDRVMCDWLGRRLADPLFGIQEAVVFGALSQDYPTDDADVVIVLQEAQLEDAQHRLWKLIEVEREFRNTFGLLLQIQRFLCQERQEFDAFVSQQGRPIRLFVSTSDS